MENKDKELEVLKNELAIKLLTEIIPKCENLFSTKGFTAAITYAVNQGISFAINHIQKYI
jgi:hypothetical protein